jgi:hypothetical protein
MTTTVGIRELSRNSKLLEQYDYVDVEDKKTHEYKGLFISPKYADEFKKYLDEKIAKEKQAQIDNLMRFIGKGSIKEEFNNLSSREIREKVAKEKYGGN